VLAHNKTLAAQLYQEFKGFFPNNAVEYFVSYYDYYQPEAYVPQSDTYIDKEAIINDEIDRMRLSATRSLFERRDVIIVAFRVVYLRPGLARVVLRDAACSCARVSRWTGASCSPSSWTRATTATTSTCAAGRSGCAGT
jgi:hypothetical protein